ncbi:MAG: hypothetical protein HZB66_02970 [Candidatus Aenigmarchaeota archaeon]|nr:hypothetical protein [Candidatus Aenigmarchaeota archaeon]
MTLTNTEKMTLKKISQLQLASKNDLKNFLKENGKGGPVVIESVIKSLSEKKCIVTLTPLGSTTFIITQRGLKILENSE